MVLLNTPEKDTDFHAVDFSLKATDGKTYTLEDCKGEKGLLLVFICNHCPYVKAIIDRLVADCKILQEQGILSARPGALLPSRKYAESIFKVL